MLKLLSVNDENVDAHSHKKKKNDVILVCCHSCLNFETTVLQLTLK